MLKLGKTGMSLKAVETEFRNYKIYKQMLKAFDAQAEICSGLPERRMDSVRKARRHTAFCDSLLDTMTEEERKIVTLTWIEGENQQDVCYDMGMDIRTLQRIRKRAVMR